MAPTTVAISDSVRSPKQPPAKLRSPSPAPANARAASLAPLSPKAAAAARLTSPEPEPSSTRATPAPESAVRHPRHRLARPPLPKQIPMRLMMRRTRRRDRYETFNQLLDLDEDETHDFSLGMTEAYFTQRRRHSLIWTKHYRFVSDCKDLKKLSALGHFLKGSSAALGVSAVQATCEDIQHYGALRDEINNMDLTDKEALAKIEPLLKRVKKEYAVAERWLQNWYKKHVPEDA
ncbi:histidine-phosphotransfer domain HPT domain-containing protein [Epithele typhae]|uniref:histidine-phosphotransfer domain HPT domain-containing protein n=1 Tax=Epithele typhae TaxID=378194 RepID=UPI0020071F93|nr:histidine-phosphotransfer domain HPT domain-containing protein [Epithele typhae]KAH9924604.1 histidine-phosphotransfer domain HPT domain-containing protein [Epithele typhae]